MESPEMTDDMKRYYKLTYDAMLDGEVDYILDMFDDVEESIIMKKILQSPDIDEKYKEYINDILKKHWHPFPTFF